MQCMAIPEAPSGRKSLAVRLLDIFKGDETLDDAAREVLEHQTQVQYRIDAARREANRGVRSKEGRFHL